MSDEEKKDKEPQGSTFNIHIDTKGEGSQEVNIEVQNLKAVHLLEELVLQARRGKIVQVVAVTLSVDASGDTTQLNWRTTHMPDLMIEGLLNRAATVVAARSLGVLGKSR